MISIEGEEEEEEGGSSHRRICWLNSTIGNNTQRIKKVLWHLSPIFNKILFRSNIRNRIFEAKYWKKMTYRSIPFELYYLFVTSPWRSSENSEKFRTKRHIDLRGRELFRPQFRRKLGEENSFVRIKYVPYPVSRISRRISVESKSEHDSIMDPRWPRYIRSITPCVAIQLCRTN